MFNDELKSVSVKALEDAISQAVSDLVGREFHCEIDKLDLSGLSADVALKLKRHNGFLDIQAPERTAA